MASRRGSYVRVASLHELQATARLVVSPDGHTIVLFDERGSVYAVDERCPHMGFPLHRGSVRDGILTCHWHHARFDLSGGGTFDQWADDVRSYPVEVRDGEVWVDLAPRADERAYRLRRLGEGLEHDIPLVVAKSVVALVEAGEDPAKPFRIGLDFGVRHLDAGWGPGLTMHTCFAALLPYVGAEDRARALYHGLSAVARECAGRPPRFPVRPLPGSEADLPTLKRWFRRFVELRDEEGAERCIVSAVRAGASSEQMADLLFAAATDHRYLSTGHVADFTSKALEALDVAGWEHAEDVLSSLAQGYAVGGRAEERNSWRHPVDLVGLLGEAFEELPEALEKGWDRRGSWPGDGELVPLLLGEDAPAITGGLLDALRQGATEEQVAGAAAHGAALRIARFNISNEFSDWDTALHSFSFANAIHQGLRRSPSPELLRGAFDAAMSVYLDRFLNVPPVPLPQPAAPEDAPAELLQELVEVLDRQQQVNAAGALVGRYLYGGGPPEALLATLGHLLLREDRSFHTIQMVEAAVRQHLLAHDREAGVHVLVAAARYLAAHSPTVRAQDQTFRIALRLHRGERLYEEIVE